MVLCANIIVSLEQWQFFPFFFRYQDEGLLPGYDGRYYYLSRTKFEKNLLIKNLSLKDNGYFECQMTHAVDGAPTSQHRAKAYVTVLGKLMAVSSSEVHFFKSRIFHFILFGAHMLCI